MRVKHTCVIDCSEMTAAECSDACLVALGHGLGFKLKADDPTDIVNGSITIAHNFPPEPHEFYIEVYEQDEAPTAVVWNGRIVGRQSALARPLRMPTAQSLRDKLNTLRTE